VEHQKRTEKETYVSVASHDEKVPQRLEETKFLLEPLEKMTLGLKRVEDSATIQSKH
jgi:hypothetical protein